MNYLKQVVKPISHLNRYTYPKSFSHQPQKAGTSNFPAQEWAKDVSNQQSYFYKENKLQLIKHLNCHIIVTLIS